ncbi:ornithine cyclodeaminase family protein [Candidatus Dojkabacteria bacterium]|uniref:Ornithine cyclodeaminase family protein n=1 Tax=Candidatus Dojkabacteria bacterium TaxID=2099670 RepID=A0A955RHR1_9BACT|nr:ornithine cyclodeaminase family protein [Candidatus Dojkabacteria bacterium]
MKLITGNDILENYDLAAIVESIKNSYLGISSGDIIVGQRAFQDTENGGDILFGTAFNKKNHRFLALGSPFMPWNGEKDLPIVTGYYMLIDTNTGDLLSVVNGNDIVRLRTAAKSTLSLKYLARKDSTTLGFIGLGDQSEFHAEALCKEFNISKILGFTRDQSKRKSTIEKIKAKTNLEPIITDIETIVKESDIVCVLSHSKEPLFNFSDLHKGQTILAGDHAESVDKDIVLNADKVFVDLISTAENEFGVVKSAIESGYDINNLSGDLTDLVANKVAGRESNDEIILFQSLGVMNENLATVEYFYDKLGKDISDVQI